MTRMKRRRSRSGYDEAPVDFGLGATLAYLKGEAAGAASAPGAAAAKDDDEGWTVVGARSKRRRTEENGRKKHGGDSTRARRRSRSGSGSGSPQPAHATDKNDSDSASGAASAQAVSISAENPFTPRHDDSGEHLPQPRNPFSTREKEAAERTHKSAQDVAKPREERRKERKLERHYPVIKHSHHARLRDMTKVSDLQALALYILADGTAPQWVSVENRTGIRKVVVLMVPGLDMALFSGKVPLKSSDIDDAPSATSEDAKRKRIRVDPDDYYPVGLKPDSLPDPLKPLSEIFPQVWPIAGPVEHRGKNLVKLHSPIHAMLSSQIPKTKEEKQLKKSGSHKGPLPQKSNHWDNRRTPITDYLVTLVDQQENDYVIHPAWFTTDEAKEAAHQRREEAHCTSKDGWVDSNVVRIEDGDVPDKDTEQGSVTVGRRVLAVDCEMCKDENDHSVLTRISLVDWDGTVVMDKLVKPDTPIKDYVTQYSGITEAMLRDVSTTLSDIQKELLDILTPHTILVGHSLNADLNAIQLTHPFVIDTGILFPHIKGPPYKQSLKYLAQRFLRKDIQKGVHGHDSVEDARTCLDLVKQKCEKGPKWGTSETNAESIFKRLERTNRPKASDATRAGAMVDWGNPNQGPGAQAKVAIGCNSDSEIVEGIRHALSGLAVGKSGTTEQIDFVYARLRELELVRGWWDDGRASDDAKVRRQAALERLGLPSDWDHELHHEALGKEVSKTVDKIVEIYQALPACTAFIVYSGTGDPREVRRLRQMHDQYREEYNRKNWRDVGVKWGEEEDRALSKAIQRARNGVGFMVVK